MSQLLISHYYKNLDKFKNSKGFKKIYFNSQSIVNKIDQLRIICSIYKPDMLCICESWLTKLHLDFEFKIQNYDIFRCDRQISRAGDVIIYSRIEVNFVVNRVHIEKSNIFESVTLKVKQKCSHPFYVSVVYISPKNVSKFKLIFMEAFKSVLNKD